jgi:hypothetical protein
MSRINYSSPLCGLKSVTNTGVLLVYRTLTLEDTCSVTSHRWMYVNRIKQDCVFVFVFVQVQAVKSARGELLLSIPLLCKHAAQSYT